MKDNQISLSLADYITLFNALLGFFAITYIIDGRFWIASIIIVITIGLDGLDGMVARYLGIEHKQGAYFDLFSDTISFCFAPAIMLYSNFYEISMGRAWESPVNFLSTAVPMSVVFFGILRLARFTEGPIGNKNYRGLPTPVIALLIICSTFLFGNGELMGYHPLPTLVFILTISILMYTTVEYPKIKDRFLVISAGSIVIISFLAVILFREITSISRIFFGISFIGCLAYTIAGPLIVKYGR
ncbi:MAG: CDP-alcohol phosphatidyltransferase family protein [Thermoplasmatota archaeon]